MTGRYIFNSCTEDDCEILWPHGYVDNSETGERAFARRIDSIREGKLVVGMGFLYGEICFEEAQQLIGMLAGSSLPSGFVENSLSPDDEIDTYANVFKEVDFAPEKRTDYFKALCALGLLSENQIPRVIEAGLVIEQKVESHRNRVAEGLILLSERERGAYFAYMKKKGMPLQEIGILRAKIAKLNRLLIKSKNLRKKQKS